MACPFSIKEIHNENKHVNMSGELPEQKLIQNYVRQGDKVLEFGANIGRSTIVAASCAGPNGMVRAFESNVNDREAANKNTKHFGTVDVLPAVSDVPLYQKGWETSTVKQNRHWKSVPTMPTSSVIGEWDVIIADCEGCFSDIAMSRPEILQTAHTIVIENDDPDFDRQDRLHKNLKGRGFESVHCAPHPYSKIGYEKRDNCFFEVLQKKK